MARSMNERQTIAHRRHNSGAIEVIDLSSESDEEILIEPAHSDVPLPVTKATDDPRLSYLKCVICLDSPTDLTATICGHLFCHECITSALRVSSTTSGSCPVCRRRTTLKSLIPLAIMKQSTLGEDPIPVGGNVKEVKEDVIQLTDNSSPLQNAQVSSKRRRQSDT